MKKKILVIEDDEIIARIYGGAYSSAGFETAIARDGQAGLDRVTTFKPDLIHLDLGVPKVDGVEVIRHIRKHSPLNSLPIIVLSNTYRNHLVKAALEAGASECVSKAVCTPKMMMEIVRRHLERSDARNPAAGREPAASHISDESPETTGAPKGSSGEWATERHAADLHAEVRASFLERAPEMVAALRDRVVPLLEAETEAARLLELSGMSTAAEKLAGHSGIAGFQDLAQMSSALVALLRELLDKPVEITASSLRTIVDACDFLAVPSERLTESVPGTGAPTVVLVVDEDAICRRAVCLALGRLNVATISVDDPKMALRLLTENRFSLIFLDVQMPEMDGFTLCEELRKTPANKTTAVVFVTSLEGFESREHAVTSGGNDLIAKPFLPMELAVKALSLLRRN